MLNIKKGGHRDLERYFTLIEMDFDSEELLPKIAIHKGMMNGSLELLIAYDEDSGMDAGYALVEGGVFAYTEPVISDATRIGQFTSAS